MRFDILKLATPLLFFNSAMAIEIPKKIELNEEEEALYAKLPKSAINVPNWSDVADAMEQLMDSLSQREAIPAVRLALFTKHAEKGSKSPKEIFESNGTKGRAIVRQPHFLEYLHHFINGPDLPKSVIEGLYKILDEDSGTSCMLRDECNKFVLNAVRQSSRNRSKLATEIFRLAVELDVDNPHSLREAAIKAR